MGGSQDFPPPYPYSPDPLSAAGGSEEKEERMLRAALPAPLLSGLVIPELVEEGGGEEAALPGALTDGKVTRYWESMLSVVKVLEWSSSGGVPQGPDGQPGAGADLRQAGRGAPALPHLRLQVPGVRRHQLCAAHHW